MEEKHFFVVHTFISDETRRAILTPPEKRNPPQKTKTEKEWGESHDGPYARCMQTGLRMKNFFIATGSPKVSRMSIGNLSMKN